MKPEYKPKDIRSFVIRAGRMTEGQKKAFNKWWPSYGLSLYDGALDFEQVFSRRASIVLEIGFGMGDSLLEMAKNEPEKNFIGIEVHPPGVGRLIMRAGEAGIENLKVYMADAKDVLAECVLDGALSRVQVYFPDPWHKKKHQKRRIIQDEFVNLVACKLQDSGILHLATDWEEYAEQMMEVLSLSGRYTNVADEYQFSPKPDMRPETKFERRGARLDHGVWDLLFRRTS